MSVDVLPEQLADAHFSAPLYTLPEAAEIVHVPYGTFRDWAVGYSRKRIGAPPSVGPALLTTADPPRGLKRGPTVPFVGLAEGYVLAAFRAAGVPLQRVRPAVQRLQEEMGLQQALASERLRTDGAEVLWDYGRDDADPEVRHAVHGLVVVRNKQYVFREVVQDYLKRVTYRNGWVELIALPRYEEVRVIVDPYVNGGAPTHAASGVRVTDIVSRVTMAQEGPEQVAYDYGIDTQEVIRLAERAAA